MNHLFEKKPLFPTTFEDIMQRISQVDPIKYGPSRNFVDGAVSYLSPYISRGVISTQYIFNKMQERGHPFPAIEKFVQELAWRDYWQQVWIAKGDAIHSDLKNKQSPVTNTGISKAIVEANTGIDAIDSAITNFYETGYLHNHLRMYIAAIACNNAQSHWMLPAKWMYYHLLDADWASNALSWQWVSGANSHKKYYANQENINTYCHTHQKGTFLDISYDKLPRLEIPEALKELELTNLTTQLPTRKKISVDRKSPTYIYNFYNLDPLWKEKTDGNRILLLEPSFFKKYPVSNKTIDFIIALSKNIKDIQVYVGEFNALISSYNLTEIYYKEHPLNIHYQGIEEPRDWMFSVKGYYPSFFGFWKKCKKEIKIN